MEHSPNAGFFQSWATRLTTPFLYHGKIDLPVLTVFILINSIVLLNSIVHPPQMGYDEVQHLNYVEVMPTRLPVRVESREFFSPPLPYFLPSVYNRACLALRSGQPGEHEQACRNEAGKFGQYVNLLLSLGITFLLLKIADKVRPENRYFKFSAIFLFGLLTVYYKTFSQMRGEPYVAFFIVAILYVLIELLSRRDRVSLKDGVWLGILLGLLVLSRQWGFFVFPALFILAAFVFWGDRVSGWKFGRVILTSFMVAFLVGSWFYWHLYFTYGSFDAFNRQSVPFSFSNQPVSFYRNLGLDNFLLFRSPVRKFFNNQFFPIFYSDTWGDYWGYFVLVPAAIGSVPANIDQITPYLGRVNLAAVFPSLILLCGIVVGMIHFFRSFRAPGRRDTSGLFMGFLFVFIVISLAGFLYFLIKYPIVPKGANIKATYMIQVFVVVPFLGAEFLEWLRSRSPKFYQASLVINVLVFLHNLPAMITHY